LVSVKGRVSITIDALPLIAEVWRLGMIGNAAFHWFAYCVGLHQADTQTSKAERDMLVNYARTSVSLLEIGVYEGVTTRAIAESMPKAAELFAVDPFYPGRLGICWPRQIAHAEVAKAKNKTVHFIELLSEQAANKIRHDFDFIFIDADHSLEGITTDWTLWSHRCRIGGIMAFHDTRTTPEATHLTNFGSFRFYNNVIRFDPNFKEIDYVDTLSVIRRMK
jgi:predicted O-methyltransferase YrrM